MYALTSWFLSLDHFSAAPCLPRFSAISRVQ